MRKAGLWLAMAGLMSSATGYAADSQVEAGRQCAQLKDSLQRLVCYDRIFLAGDAAAPAAPRAMSPAPTPALPAARAAIPATAPAPAVAPPAVAPAFGDETLQRKSKEKPAEPARLEAKITALKEIRPNVVRMALDNGQSWQQMDMSSVFQVTVGDTVRIEKGKMGGYRLTRTSRGGSGWVRVARLE
jgi:hypothetical protein